MRTVDIISMCANLALALSFIVGLVFGIAQVHAAARDRRERLTLETLRNIQTREFTELMHDISHRDLPTSATRFSPNTSSGWPNGSMSGCAITHASHST